MTLKPTHPQPRFLNMKASLCSLAVLAGAASAHTIFQEVYVNGVDQGHLNGIRYPNYDGVRTIFSRSTLVV